MPIPVTKPIGTVPAVPPPGIVPGDVHQYPATSIKKRGNGSYVPPAQQERILNRHILGESMRKISREEHRDFRTIAKVLRNNPGKLREHLELCRAQFCALAIVALETIRRAMENGDVRLAYRVLVDGGAVPPPGYFPWVTQPESTETPETIGKKKFIDELVEMAMEPAEDHGLPSDSVELRPPRIAGNAAKRKLF
jgi:hypothetical protein